MSVKDDNIKIAKWTIGVLFVISVIGSGVLSIIFFIVNICQVVLPRMKTGNWGDYSKIEDTVQIPDDSWYVVREAAACPLFTLFVLIFAALVGVFCIGITVMERRSK